MERNSLSPWLTAVSLLLTLVMAFIPTTSTEYIFLEIAMWVLILISVSYSTELTLSLFNVTVWYNVLVVSVLITVPQTIIALQLANQGLYLAAWLDSILSTVVDATIATALVRRHIIGSTYIKGLLPNMVAWSIIAFTINVATATSYTPDWLMAAWLIAGYIALPLWIVKRTGGGGTIPPPNVLFNSFMNTVAMAVASYYLSEALYQLRLSEASLGVVATVLATLPDLIVALIIRSAFSLIIGDVASDQEVVATMLAGAIHDQISVPALILLLDPKAAPYFPHEVALFAIVVKFALLDRKVFYLIGLPASIALLIGLGAHH
ncbi:MAG: hypothetical protein QXT27_06260 [Pyrobaculum sp.]